LKLAAESIKADIPAPLSKIFVLCPIAPLQAAVVGIAGN